MNIWKEVKNNRLFNLNGKTVNDTLKCVTAKKMAFTGRAIP